MVCDDLELLRKFDGARRGSVAEFNQVPCRLGREIDCLPNAMLNAAGQETMDQHGVRGGLANEATNWRSHVTQTCDAARLHANVWRDLHRPAKAQGQMQ